MRAQKMFKQGVLWLGGLVLAAALVLLPYPSGAVEKTWVGGTSWWDFGFNWDPWGQPGDGDEVNLTQSDDVDRTVYYWNTLDPDPVLNSLKISATGSGNMTFDMFIGHPLFAESVDIGWHGTGTFSHSAGTAEIGLLRMGAAPGRTGIYELSGDAILRVDLEEIGHFTQTGGSHVYSYDLVMGFGSADSSSYTLDDGSLSGTNSWIGGFGDGNFIQTGGSHTVAETLTIGRVLVSEWSGGNGTYELRGGTLEANNEDIRGLGTATFIQTGGSNTVIEELRIGDEGTCTYELRGGTLGANNVSITGFGEGFGPATFTQSGGNLEADSEYVSRSGTGSFFQSGGRNFMDNYLYLGFGAGSRGLYRLEGDGELLARNEVIGAQGRGDFTQEDGSNSANNLILGRDGSGIGTYALRGGILRAHREGIGFSGSGTFTQTGGENRIRDLLILGVNPGSSGEYFLENGTLRTGSLEVTRRGTFTQTGGSLTAGPLTNAGIVNLEGGIVNVTGDIANQISGRLNISTDVNFPGDTINDGTIKTTGATVTWGGTFINNGNYVSDPSTQVFNNLVVGPQGLLVGFSQDIFVVTGNLEIQSTQHQQWQTDQATLQFLNAVNNPNLQQINETEQLGMHAFYIPGEDRGPGGGADNFRWGTLMVDGVTVHILDGNPQNQGSALYVGKIEGLKVDENTLTILNICSPEGLYLYYDPFLNQDLQGLIYSLSGLNGQVGGKMMPTPVPASVLLFGSGLLGLGLMGWRRQRG